MKKDFIVITRHNALVSYLIEKGVVDRDVEIHAHATRELVTGRNVIGVLPHSLSALTNTFTEVPLALPQELRGVELTVNDIRRYALPIVTYSVSMVEIQ